MVDNDTEIIYSDGRGIRGGVEEMGDDIVPMSKSDRATMLAEKSSIKIRKCVRHMKLINFARCEHEPIADADDMRTIWCGLLHCVHSRMNSNHEFCGPFCRCILQPKISFYLRVMGFAKSWIFIFHRFMRHLLSEQKMHFILFPENYPANENRTDLFIRSSLSDIRADSPFSFRVTCKILPLNLELFIPA